MEIYHTPARLGAAQFPLLRIIIIIMKMTNIKIIIEKNMAVMSTRIIVKNSVLGLEMPVLELALLTEEKYLPNVLNRLC